MAELGPRPVRRRYLVTGASSGIGLAIVKALTQRGHDVVGTGARAVALLPADYPDIPYVCTNLAVEPESLPSDIGDIDRLIVAAGIGFYRPIEVETAADITEVLAVNFGAVVRLLHGFYPALARQHGRVALLGSIATKGAAQLPVYAASKGALAGLARSLGAEWAGRVVLRHYRLWPVRTSMHQRAGYDPRNIDFMLMDAEAVAAHIIATLERNGRPSLTVNPATLFGGALWRSAT